MSVQLHLITVDDEEVPILWDPINGDFPDDYGFQQIRTMEDMDIARMAGASNRSRTVTIVESRDAARMLAMMERDNHSSRVAISQLSDAAWVVGSTLRDGSYDSGIPSITDTREFGEEIELDLDEAMLEETGFIRLSGYDSDILELNPRDQPSFRFG